MGELIIEMIQFPFMQRAIIAGSLIALTSALLGVCLVLKRFSMIGDGLSHVGFSALAIASVCGWAPLAVAIPVVVIAAFFLLKVSNNKDGIKADAAIALVSTSALAIGVIVLSLTTGMTTDVNNYMFGSILAMSDSDAVIGSLVCLVTLALFVLFYNRIFAVTFDENFAGATGIRSDKYKAIIAVLTAVIIVIGLRLVGAMLISGLLIFPALSAMKISKSYKGVTVSAGIIALLCFAIGLVLSFFAALPTGACIILVNLICFIVCTVFGK